MEKKYYDLIVSLIKNHRKFAGCEAILDDIAEDVYNHAKVVLDTIDNEDVITSYLSKVVSTSIITVPKKLNINPRVSHRVIMPELKEPRKVVKNEIEINVPAPQRTETPELSFDNLSDETLQENLTTTDELELTEELSIDEPLQEIQGVTEDEIIDDFAEEPLEIENPVLDNNQNDFDNDQNEDNYKVENNTEENVLENAEELPELDFEKNEEINNLFEEDNSVLETVEEDVENNDIIDESITDSESTISEEEDTASEIEDTVDTTNEVNKELVDKMINGSISTDLVSSDDDDNNIEELEETNEETLPVDDGLLETDDYTIEELPEEPLLENSEEEMLLGEDVADVTPLEEIKATATEIQEDSNENNENNDGFTPPNYKYFDYEPDIEPTYDVDEINECLIELDTKHPEWHVMEICELKYKDNKTVEEISERLGLDVEAVVDTLSEVICAIKD